MALVRAALASPFVAATVALAVLAAPAPALADVRLVVVGDVMLDRDPGRALAAGKDPFEHVGALLRGGDLAVANLECVVATTGRREQKEFTFRADPRALPLLARYFDAVSLANNHT